MINIAIIVTVAYSPFWGTHKSNRMRYIHETSQNVVIHSRTRSNRNSALCTSHKPGVKWE